MHSFTAAEISTAVSGQIVQGSPDRIFVGVSTDTRQISKGDLFIALIGEQFDAHDFIDQALAGGAGGIVVSREVATGNWEGTVIRVPDTLIGLQLLARWNREKFHGIVIGVTGSNGKTTTKDMIAAVLGRKYNTLKTQGNFNNHIGLPLTLLKLDQTYEAVVLEMGMRGLREIDLLAGLAKPGGVVITNIGETHIERLGSVANIARAKGEILNHLADDGFAVLNGDDPLVRQLGAKCQGKVIYYGIQGDSEIWASNLELNDKHGYSFILNYGKDQISVNLPMPGRHNVLNALAAAGVGLNCALTLSEIKEGLEDTPKADMRLEICRTEDITVINDTYNANPASMKAALGILSDMGKGSRKVAILGDMYELGHRTAEGHREVGTEAAKKSIDILITVGRSATEIALGATLAIEPPAEIVSVNTNAEVIHLLKKIIKPGDVILVKGSRGMKMEQIVMELLKRET